MMLVVLVLGLRLWLLLGLRRRLWLLLGLRRLVLGLRVW